MINTIAAQAGRAAIVLILALAPVSGLAQGDGGLSRAEIMLLQENLNTIGIDVGGADGVPGRRTEAGLARLAAWFSRDGTAGLDAATLELSREIAASRTQLPELSTPAFWFAAEKDVATIDLREAHIPCIPPRCEMMDFPLAHLDIDNDGFEDLLIAVYYFIDGVPSGNTQPFLFLRNDGEGGFQEHDPGFTVDVVHPREALVEDFNGDGRDDVFVLDHGRDANPFPGAQSRLLLSSDSGIFDATATHLPAREDFSHGGAAGDLDGDGDLDILVITNQSRAVSHDSYVLENDGTGKFVINDSPGYISSSLLSIRSRGRDFGLNNSAEIADVDGDGHVDIIWLASGDAPSVAASKSGAQFSHVTFSNGQNNYLSENTFDLPLARWGHRTFVADIALLDFDEDGDFDLVATSNTRKPNNGDWAGVFVDLLENTGDRRFVNVTHNRFFRQGYPDADILDWNHWVTVADINLDDRPDLVFYNLDPLVKDGLFEPAYAYDTAVKLASMTQFGSRFMPVAGLDATKLGYTMRRMLVLDVDNDGDLDLVGTKLLQGPDIGGEMSFVGFTLQVKENFAVQ